MTERCEDIALYLARKIPAQVLRTSEWIEEVAALLRPHVWEQSSLTRFDNFDARAHPFCKWWKKYGQFMLSGGGRVESIWAASGWIAREQLMCGVPVTGESLAEAALPSAPLSLESKGKAKTV